VFGFRVWGRVLRVSVWCFWFMVHGLLFSVQGLGFTVSGLGIRV
jgi:hypothetical protein